MSTYHSLFRLKKWSLFLFLFLLIGGLATVSSSFAACEYLSNDFSSADGLTASQSTGHWTVVTSGMLDVQGIGEISTYASMGFWPSDFFSVDVDIDIISATNDSDRVGVRIYTGGDVFFGVNGDSGEHTTNGVLCYYYPNTGLLKFKVYDFDTNGGEWVVPLAARSVSGTVNSIGLSMVADGVIFRVNGQDTTYKLTGDFSWGAYNVIDTLRLFAGGTGLHARFDDVCASPYEVTDFQPGNAMPLPSGQEAAIITTPAASPVTSIVPASANPFGFGQAASGGNTLSLTAGISGLLYPADLYVGIQIGAEIYLFDAANGIHPLSTDGLVKWRANTTGGLNNVPLLPPGIDMSGIPGTYNFYFLMTPAGRLDSFRLWVTPLVIAGGGSSVITDTAMEAEVRQNIDLIFGLTSGFSGGLTEVMSIFNEKSVVTMTPVKSAGELDLMAVLGGAPLTINANFGSGYTMQSGKIMGGSARIVANPSFSDTSLGASFSGTFNNVTKDGAPFANGQVSGNVLLTEGAAEKTNVSGQININNLSISGQQLSGTIDISGILEDFDLFALLGALTNLDLAKLIKMKGNIRLTFSSFTSGAYTINSGYVDIISTGSGSANVITNLQTGAGPVNLNMSLTTSATGAVINTNAPGAAGPYTLSMQNVTLDQNACPNYPTGGTISFTRTSTGTTGVVTFTGTCDGSYGYGER